MATCVPTNSCVEADYAYGLCHSGLINATQAPPYFYNATYVNSGCNDCDICHQGLCLFCAHNMTDVFFCGCEYVPIVDCCHNQSDCGMDYGCINNTCVLTPGIQLYSCKRWNLTKSNLSS